MSTIISIENLKGGVGKSATALNLGAALATAENRVLLVDADVQGNLTAALGFTPGEIKNTLAKLFLTAIDNPEDLELQAERAILQTESGVDLIPANRRLGDAAARLQIMQMGQYSSVSEATQYCETVLSGIVEYYRNNYDYILIDCGLKHELLTVNALVASDYCIIPVQAHFLASEGIPEVLDLIRTVQLKFNPRLKIAGILLTMYQSRPQLCQSVRASVGDIYGGEIHVFERPIEHTIKIAECPAVGKSIFEHAPKNPAADSYRNLAREVMELGHLQHERTSEKQDVGNEAGVRTG